MNSWAEVIVVLVAVLIYFEVRRIRAVVTATLTSSAVALWEEIIVKHGGRIVDRNEQAEHDYLVESAYRHARKPEAPQQSVDEYQAMRKQIEASRLRNIVARADRRARLL